jgi:hypothetical protein
VTGVAAIVVYFLIVAVWIAALVFSIRVNRQEKRQSIPETEKPASRVV